MIATINITKHNSGKVINITEGETKHLTQMLLEAMDKNKNLRASVLFAAVSVIKKDMNEEISNKVLNVAMKNMG